MRYKNEKLGLLDSQHYKEYLEERGLKDAVIIRSVNFKNLGLIEVPVGSYGLWTAGSSLQKISQEVYGTIEYWWTIGLINAKPTDAHFNLGDEILIPTSPDVIKNIIGDY